MSQERAKQLVEAGLWLRISGDNEGALRLFEQALKLDPGNQRARQYLEMGRQGLPTPPPFQLEQRPADNPFERKDPPGSADPLDEWLGGLPPPPAAPAAGSAWEAEGGPSISLPAAEARPHDPLDLLTRPAQPPPPPVARVTAPDAEGVEHEVATLLHGVEDLLELDDHSGVMELLAKAEQLAPGDPRVQAMRERSEQTLLAMVESKLGDLRRIPRVRLQNDDIIWLNLDHRAGFVLAQIDGTVSYEDLFAVSGMSRLDTARILVQLLDEGVITHA